jgi:ribosomal protein S27AE
MKPIESTEPSAEWLATWGRLLADLKGTFTVGPAFKPELYERYLADVPEDVLEAAVAQLIATRRYPTFPTIGDLRETAAELVEVRFPSAIEAWDEVGRFLKSAEPKAFPWTNPLAKRCAEAMDVFTLRNSQAPGVDRAHFFQAYDGLLARARAEARIVPQARALLEARPPVLELPAGVETPVDTRPVTRMRLAFCACGESGMLPEHQERLVCAKCRALGGAIGA